MELTHFSHACVLVQTAATRLLIDPGTLSSGFESIRDLDAVLITCDPELAATLHRRVLADWRTDAKDRLPALLAANPRAVLLVDSGSAASTSAAGLSAEVLEVGSRRRIGGSAVEVIGGRHATVHSDIPVVPNSGLIVDDGAFYHPGDSYFVPETDIDVLAVPTSGPWLKVGEAIDFLRAVGPRVAIPIHEAALASTATHYGMLAGLAPAGTAFTPLDRAVPTAV